MVETKQRTLVAKGSQIVSYSYRLQSVRRAVSFLAFFYLSANTEYARETYRFIIISYPHPTAAPSIVTTLGLPKDGSTITSKRFPQTLFVHLECRNWNIMTGQRSGLVYFLSLNRSLSINIICNKNSTVLNPLSLADCLQSRCLLLISSLLTFTTKLNNNKKNPH